MRAADISPRVILRIVLIVVGVVITLYVVYLLRKPISWIIIASFLAVAMSGPVNLMARRMRRGLAIFLSYLGLLLVPVLLGAILVPPIVNGINDLAAKAPDYAAQARDYVENNRRLRKLEADYGVITKLEEEAQKLPSRAGTAANTLKDLGVGLVNSIFAGVTILILSVFMVANGRRWVSRAIALRPPDHVERLEAAVDRISAAVGNYVAGALAQATIAGLTGFIVMTLLGIPFAGPLAVLVGVADLIPLVGATLAAILVGIVTLFADFPIDTIIWVIWAVIYQQLENSVIQPQIQRRAVDLNPFVTLVAVLFGSTLFGILGALLAIPFAAALQIAVMEWWRYRQEMRVLAAPNG
ncbi:MAG TPA: AI-2E family transporter [Solirubrobacteraceae bacterium]|jgi:predicted PurR-regulated permease PerM